MTITSQQKSENQTGGVTSQQRRGGQPPSGNPNSSWNGGDGRAGWQRSFFNVPRGGVGPNPSPDALSRLAAAKAYNEARNGGGGGRQSGIPPENIEKSPQQAASQSQTPLKLVKSNINLNTAQALYGADIRAGRRKYEPTDEHFGINREGFVNDPQNYAWVNIRGKAVRVPIGEHDIGLMNADIRAGRQANTIALSNAEKLQKLKEAQEADRFSLAIARQIAPESITSNQISEYGQNKSSKQTQYRMAFGLAEAGNFRQAAQIMGGFSVVLPEPWEPPATNLLGGKPIHEGPETRMQSREDFLMGGVLTANEAHQKAEYTAYYNQLSEESFANSTNAVGDIAKRIRDYWAGVGYDIMTLNIGRWGPKWNLATASPEIATNETGPILSKSNLRYMGRDPLTGEPWFESLPGTTRERQVIPPVGDVLLRTLNKGGESVNTLADVAELHWPKNIQSGVIGNYNLPVGTARVAGWLMQSPHYVAKVVPEGLASTGLYYYAIGGEVKNAITGKLSSPLYAGTQNLLSRPETREHMAETDLILFTAIGGWERTGNEIGEFFGSGAKAAFGLSTNVLGAAAFVSEPEQTTKTFGIFATPSIIRNQPIRWMEIQGEKDAQLFGFVNQLSTKSFPRDLLNGLAQGKEYTQVGNPVKGRITNFFAKVPEYEGKGVFYADENWFSGSLKQLKGKPQAFFSTFKFMSREAKPPGANVAEMYSPAQLTSYGDFLSARAKSFSKAGSKEGYYDLLSFEAGKKLARASSGQALVAGTTIGKEPNFKQALRDILSKHELLSQLPEKAKNNLIDRVFKNRKILINFGSSVLPMTDTEVKGITKSDIDQQLRLMWRNLLTTPEDVNVGYMRAIQKGGGKARLSPQNKGILEIWAIDEGTKPDWIKLTDIHSAFGSQLPPNTAQLGYDENRVGMGFFVREPVKSPEGYYVMRPTEQITRYKAARNAMRQRANENLFTFGNFGEFLGGESKRTYRALSQLDVYAKESKLSLLKGARTRFIRNRLNPEEIEYFLEIGKPEKTSPPLQKPILLKNAQISLGISELGKIREGSPSKKQRSLSHSLKPSPSGSISRSISKSLSKSISPSISTSRSPSLSKSVSPSISKSISLSHSFSSSRSLSRSLSLSISGSPSPSQSRYNYPYKPPRTPSPFGFSIWNNFISSNRKVKSGKFEKSYLPDITGIFSHRKIKGNPPKSVIGVAIQPVFIGNKRRSKHGRRR